MHYRYTLECPRCKWVKSCHPLVIDEVAITDFSKMQCSTCWGELICNAIEESPVDEVICRSEKIAKKRVMFSDGGDLESPVRKVINYLSGSRYKAEGVLGELKAAVNDSIG